MILTFILLISTACAPKQQISFPVGKDTVETFSDGSFQIVKNPDRTLALCNVKYNSTVIDKVKQYKKTEQAIMIKGTLKKIQMYAVMDITDNKLYCLIETTDNNFQMEKPLHLENMINEGSLVICNDYQEFVEALYHLLGNDMKEVYREALKN